MALPPGLLPESTETIRSRSPLVLGAVVAVALLAILGLLIQNRRLAAERDEALSGARLRSSGPSAVAPAEAPAAPDRTAVVPGSASPSPDPVPLPVVPRAPRVRVLPEDPQYVTRGLQEFRAGRYEQAERQFFRGLPDSLLYLSITSLAQRNWPEAFSFLARAMNADPHWLRRVNPRDLFGRDGDYDALLGALDEQLAKTPIDPDLKTLAAYLRYHEKGAPYAKALLIEATNLNPDHEAAKAFLEALGP
jgi:tetratricopeptide (TPR) repeat protein